MISAIVTTRTVASRWRRKAPPLILTKLKAPGPRGASSPGEPLGRSVLLSTASLTLLFRSLRRSYSVPAVAQVRLRSPQSRWSGGARACRWATQIQSYTHHRPGRSSGPDAGDEGHAPTAGGPPGSRIGRACRRRGSRARGGRWVGHVLVTACGELMAPDGRGMYFCAVVEPWYRLGVVYGPALLLVMMVRPVSVSGGASVPPEMLYRYM